MFLQSLIFLFLFTNVNAAGPAFPICTRPTNFSAPGALKKFEACQKSQGNVYNFRPKEKTVNESCFVTSNGQYRCKEKPLRFVEKEVAPQPQIPKQENNDEDTSTKPTPAASATPSESPAPNK